MEISGPAKRRRTRKQPDRRPSPESLLGLPLDEQVERVLQLPAADRVAFVQACESPREVVGRWPAEEVLLTVEELGYDAALPVLAATNAEQFTFLTDIEIWDKEEIDWERTRAWMLLLVQCGEKKVLDWLRGADPELVVLIVKKFLTLFKTEAGHNPDTDLPRFTLDGIYHFCSADSQLLDAFRTILTLLRAADRDQYLLIVESALWAQLTELEHEAARWRQSRLAEYGFPDEDEAAEIYRYVPPEEAPTLVDQIRRPRVRTVLPQVTPRYPLQLLEQSDNALMVRGLHLLPSAQDVAFVSRGLIAVANRLQVADSLPLGRLPSIRAAAAKTAGYINIALEILADDRPERAAELLASVHAQHLFRIGSSRIEDVADRARRIVRRGWLKNLPGAQVVLDTPEREVLEGLLRGRVQLYTGEAEGEGYRDFRYRADLELASAILEEIEAIGHLFLDHLRLTPPLFAEILKRAKIWAREHDLRLSTIFLTAAVRWLLGQEFRPEPLAPAELAEFLRIVRGERSGSKGRGPIWPHARRRLMRLIDLRGCRRSRHLHEPLRRFVYRQWRRMEMELADIDLHRGLDPRYIQTLIVAPGRSRRHKSEGTPVGLAD